MFTGRLNLWLVGLGMAAGRILLMLSSQAAAEGRGLHSHHRVFLLWFSNRATTVLWKGSLALWHPDYLFWCVCFLIASDLSHCMGVLLLDQMQEKKWEHMWDVGTGKRNCPLRQQPAAKIDKVCCESAPRARGGFSSIPVCWWLSCRVRLQQSYLTAA